MASTSTFYNLGFRQSSPELATPMPISWRCRQATVENDDSEISSDLSESPPYSRHSSPSALSRRSSYDLDTSALIATLAPTVALARHGDSAHTIARSLWGKFPPKNFGQVLPGIYRSGFPQPENYPFLRVLGLKTILTLVPEEYTDSGLDYSHDLNVQHFQVAIKPNKGCISISKADMESALEIVMDPRNHPLLIHCNKGKHRTGCVVACFRKCHDWNLVQVINEYHQYAGIKARALDVDFIETWEDPLIRQMCRSLARTQLTSSTPFNRSASQPLFDTLDESPIRSGRISTRLRS